MKWTDVLIWIHVNFALFYYMTYEITQAFINNTSDNAKVILLFSQLGLGMFSGVFLAYAAKLNDIDQIQGLKEIKSKQLIQDN